MDFVSLSQEVLARGDLRSFAPGFVERLKVVTGANSNMSRTIAEPFYLTDLGIRRFDDPSLFFQLNMDVTSWSEAHRQEESVELLTTSPVQNLTFLLDAYILLIGDYDGGQRAVTERFQEILDSGDHKLLVCSAVLLASLGDEGCRELFQAAALAGQQPTGKFMALHRLAAAEIKRFNRPDSGVALLDALDAAMAQDESIGELSRGDLASLYSVTANLRALAFIRLGRHEDAHQEVARSVQLATLDGLRVVNRSEAARYSAQESINLAQTFIGGGATSDAARILQDNVAFCAANSRDYLSEALASQAYGLFLVEDYRESVQVAGKAIERIVFEASPSRLRAARETLIGALACVDEMKEAENQLVLSETDPLGLQILRALEASHS